MNVLVTGLGNIGTTIANVLLTFKDILSVDKVYVHKNLPNKWQEEDVNMLVNKGAILCNSDSSSSDSSISSVLSTVDYVFECRENGIGTKNLDFYKSLKNLKGVCAQGSEQAFGVPFMAGLNEDKIKGEKFVHVISCNTHAVSSILQTLSGKKLENLQEADFVIVRRSEDLGSHKKLVGANVVVRHLDSQFGTHHAQDVRNLFKSIGVDCPLTTSDISTPSQLLHGVRFNLTFKKPLKSEDVLEKIRANEYMAITHKFDSNQIFELGRRYGFQGRIYAHAIVVTNNFLIHEKNIKGWSFVPQEGNTILSSIAAFLLQTSTLNYEDVMSQLKGKLLQERW